MMRDRLGVGLRLSFVAFSAATVHANIVAAEPTLLARYWSALPSVVLLVVVEILLHVKPQRHRLELLRIPASVVVACCAALLSWGHMVKVSGDVGETGALKYLYPLVIDGGLVVVAVSLIVHSMAKAPARRKPAPKKPAAPKSAVKAAPVPVDIDGSKMPTTEARTLTVQLREAGESWADIAERVGRSERQCKRYLENEEVA